MVALNYSQIKVLWKLRSFLIFCLDFDVSISSVQLFYDTTTLTHLNLTAEKSLRSIQTKGTRVNTAVVALCLLVYLTAFLCKVDIKSEYFLGVLVMNLRAAKLCIILPKFQTENNITRVLSKKY